MNNVLREQLSALADDELGYMEVELLLRRYAGDGQLRARWNTYHVIGEALREDNPQQRACTIADRVADALAAEPTPHSQRQHRWQTLWRPVSAAAVVAVIGVAAVLVVQQKPFGGDTMVRSQMAAQQPVVLQTPVQYNITGANGAQSSPRVQRQLHAFLATHSQDFPTLDSRAMLPQARMAVYRQDNPFESGVANHHSNGNGAVVNVGLSNR